MFVTVTHCPTTCTESAS